jgi:hypothetical protein
MVGTRSTAKLWIKVCNAQSEPDWSIKKAEPKLRSVLRKTHKRNSPRANLYTLYNLARINFNQTDCFRVSVYIPSGAMAFREID